MTLTPGTKLGPYEIAAPLGKGGMGEVYRARDPRLGRDVAIKALPAAFAQDPERLARFEREAKLLASLSHPNVGAIYGLEEVEGQRYLVLELVEGETLSARLERGALPMDEALEVCRQIAAALESAHESGVVHRDLKPGNVMLTPSGVVKVLDFGLAKAGAAGASSDPGLSASPTMTYAATGAGVILGTAAYMSPEQARGKSVDKRTDIWSFGCVQFECLAGQQCFAGETVSDLIARILQVEPEWDALPAKTPTRVRALLKRCLDKDAKRRLRDIGDARIEIEDVIAQRTSSSSMAAGSTAHPRQRRGVQLAMVIAAAVVGVVATRGTQALFDRAPAATPVRFEVPEPDGMTMDFDGAQSVLSPDGKSLVFVASDSARARLWVRSLDNTTARPLEGTEDATLPFWSADSRHVGFFTRTKMRRVPVGGGDVEDLCDVKRARGGTWNRQDVIVYAPTSDGVLYRIPAGGGDPVAITTLDSTRHETAHRFPTFLPDGQHYLFSVLPPKDGKFEIDAGELGSTRRERVLTAGSGAVYSEPGYLLYLRNGAIAAQRFNPRSRKVAGEPVTLREAVSGTSFSGGPGFSASRSGAIAYSTLRLPSTRLVWNDLAGREIGRAPVEPSSYVNMELSPDNRRVTLMRLMSNLDSEIWIGDLDRGVVTRLSQEPGTCESAHWSPDGTKIAYLVGMLGPQRVVIRDASGAGPVETYLESDPTFKELYGWSPDGRMLVFGRQDPATRWDLWLLPLEGDHTPRRYLNTPFNDQGGQISKDRRWMAYTSDESGRPEGYVQSFPAAGAKYQVTNGGGGIFAWSSDGRKLGFGLNSKPNTAMVADVVPGSEFRLGPMSIFCSVPKDALTARPASDWKRLLTLMPAGKPPVNTTTVVLDWRGALKKR